MKNQTQLLLTTLVIIFVNPLLINAQNQAQEASVSNHQISLSFNPDTRTFELLDASEGLILSAGIIKANIGGEIISTDDHRINPIVKKNSKGILSMHFHENLMVIIRLSGDGKIKFSTEGTITDSVWFTARAPLSDRTMGGLLHNQQDGDRNTVVQTMGFLDVPGLISIFDPLKDLALQISSDGMAGWERNYQWQLEASALVGQGLCVIQLFRHYYRDTLGITYYAPIKKRGYFQKAPALAMTWVGIEGKYNRPYFSQRKEWLYPNIDWVSEHLLPYAGEMIFQLDDNYPIDDPQYMRDISDYIRRKNLIPGIWIAPFGVAPFEEEKKHPKWFIHKADGSAITTFSGLSYDDVRHYISTVLNVNSDEGVEKWFAGFLRQVNNEWNYDYYKVDGIPAALNVYKQSVDGGGVEGVRRGLQIFRDVVGPDKYINTCWGLPLEGIDIVNGSRVGGDTEQANQVVSQVAVAHNYLNNVAWYSDPDGAANMYASTEARARLNFQGRALLGQPYVTDDNWTKVPNEILFVWQRTLPTIESFPTNLYKISEPNQYDHFDLKIKKPWGEWDIASLNNYENSARQMTLDLGRMPLNSEELYIYDFWNQKYIGKHSAEAKISINMEPIDAQCFSLVPVQNNRPVLISTSRHITQGGVDLVDVKQWKADDKDAWYFDGKSNHLIKDDPYELVFMCNGYDLNNTIAVKGGSVKLIKNNGLVRVQIIPMGSDIEWKLGFISNKKASIYFGVEEIHLIPGQSMEVPIIVENIKKLKWKVSSSNKNIKIKSDYTRSMINIEVDKEAVELGETLSGMLTLQTKNKDIPLSTMLVETQGPARKNIAGQAKATASSVYFNGDQNGYGRPVGANDGRTFRAWEAAEGETTGWLKLVWEKPVTFQRIVIDEWMESGGEIQSWELEAEGVGVIKMGETIGRGFVIEMDKPITTQVLKLNILKASKRPGVWEIEVNLTHSHPNSEGL